jgi:hypothetical protein
MRAVAGLSIELTFAASAPHHERLLTMHAPASAAASIMIPKIAGAVIFGQFDQTDSATSPPSSINCLVRSRRFTTQACVSLRAT